MTDDATQPNAEPTEPATTDKPDPLAHLPNLVNSAVSSQLKRALGSLDKTIAEAVAKAVGSAAPAPQAAPQSGSAPVPSVDPALAKLREELDAHKRELEAERRRVRETEERSRAERTDASLREALRKAVRPELIDGAFYALKATSLRFDEDGTPKLAISRRRERDRPAEEVAFSIEDGVSDWLKSEAAKAYLPPPVAPPAQKTHSSIVVRPIGADGRPRAMSREEAIDAALAAASDPTRARTQ